MKYLKQFEVILFFSFVGEALHAWLPFPVPASIYGTFLLLLALETKVVPVAAIKEASVFLIEAMPVMFIPAAVGLMDSWPLIQKAWLPYGVITLATTFAVMAASGKAVQFMVQFGAKRRGRP